MNPADVEEERLRELVADLLAGPQEMGGNEIGSETKRNYESKAGEPLDAQPRPTKPNPAPEVTLWVTGPAGRFNLSSENIPRRRWLYGSDLVRGDITVLAAPGGVGKSSLATGMSVALASGEPLLGEKIWGKQSTVLYLSSEDSRIEIARRVWAACLRHPIPKGDHLGRLHIFGADDPQTQQLSLLRTERQNCILDKDGILHLENLLATVKPDLMVLDPLISFCGGGNVNDNAIMSLLMGEVKRLAIKFSCAVLIIHHTKKRGDLSNAEAISGASSIVNLARRAINAVPMTPDQAKQLRVLPSEKWRYFRVTSSKSNLAPPSQDAPWYQLVTVQLPNAERPPYEEGDHVQAVVRATLTPINDVQLGGDDQKIRRAILDVAQRGKEIDGQTHLYSVSSVGRDNQRSILNDAMDAVKQVTADKHWKKEDLKAAVTYEINRMKVDGWLVNEKIPNGRFRRLRGLRVDWSKTPWPNKETDESSEAAHDLEEACSPGADDAA